MLLLGVVDFRLIAVGETLWRLSCCVRGGGGWNRWEGCGVGGGWGVIFLSGVVGVVGGGIGVFGGVGLP